ncbi:phosphotransferase [Anaerobacillus sp. 1_MG-2023]|uniref:phosphotransferase n=1 Tax=Bacillales TaxID=1385 RepID=UPI0026E2370E|nr:phosphotransferase [Anaerobacillus sp. 1_MG-2023]MDO6656038.1 phosphotransferase [Anaerobacillus sp. 1_MG-2023]
MSDPALLFQYDLYPERVVQMGKITKIETERGAFALKKAQLSKEQMDRMLYLEERFKQLKFEGYVPLVRTKYGDSFVYQGDHIVYLTPWVDERETSPAQKDELLVHHLAELHGYTAKEQAFSEEVIKQSYQKMVLLRESRQFEMEKYVSHIEKRIYLSPFELTFVSHFHQLMRYCELAKRRLDDWYEQILDAKRYRSVLCHGKCSPSHYVSSAGRGYFINFEKSVSDTPIRDLAYFIRSSIQPFQFNPAATTAHLARYEAQFSLNDEEKELLASYLYFPESVFNSVLLFNENRQQWPHIKHVRLFTKKIEVMNGINKVLENF